MSRFRELKRIELAIEHGGKSDLEWAARYCKMRVRMARRKDHQKYWRRIEQKVQRAQEKSA